MNKPKKFFTIGMVLCILFTQAGFNNASDGPLFALVTDVQGVETGEKFTIRLQVNDADDIYGFEASVMYNPGVAEFVMDESLMTYDGFCMEMPDVQNGRLLIAFTRIGEAEPIRGDADLFIMKFKALQEGTIRFILEYVKTVDSGEKAQVYTAGSEVSVICGDTGTGETPAPSPTVTPSPTPSTTPGASPGPSDLPEPTGSPAPTISPAPTTSPTATPAATPTTTPTITPMPTPSAEQTATPGPTVIPSPSPGVTLDLSDKTRTSTLDDGTIETYLPESALEDIEEGLEQGGTVIIHAGRGDEVQSFNAPVELFAIVAEKQGSVTLDYGNLQIKIPGSALDIEKICRDTGVEDASGLQVNLRVTEVPAEEVEAGSDTSIVGKVFQITFEVVTQDGESMYVTSFIIPVELKIPETGERPGDYVEGTRNVYKIDVEPPQYCYTYFDGEHYVAGLTGFSQYAVLEYRGAFGDVPESHWAGNYIRVLAAKNIAEGVGNNLFNPGRYVTRAEFTKMLVKALNLKTSDYTGIFIDVPAQAWHAPYIEAAARAGIVQGTGNGRFAPDSVITREQMAVMVMNAYCYANGRNTGDIAKGYDGKLTDIGNASKWAIDSIKAAYAEKIITGTLSGVYMLAGFSQRDQAAAVIARLLERLNRL